MSSLGPASSGARFAVSRPAALDAGVIGATAAVVYALHGFHGHLDRDLGIFVYGGEQVARGTAPYVANFNTVGPLADGVPGLADAVGRLVGIGPVLAPRLLDWIISAACVVLVALLTRQVSGSRRAGYLAAAMFVTFGSFLNLATDGPREKTAMVLFLLGALILLCRRRFLLAGVLTALATLTWQPVILPLLAAGAVAAFLAPRRLRAAGLFALGGGATAALTALSYVVVGALPRALDAFLIANVLWVHQPSAFSRPAATWHLLWHSYGPSLAIAVLGPVVLLVLALRRRTAPLLLTAAGGVVAVGWTAAVVNGSPDLFVVLPFGALGGALFVQSLLAGLRERRPRLALGVVAALCAVGVAAAAATAVLTRDHRLDLQVRDVAAVVRSAPAGAGMVAIDAPEPLALTGRISPTPFLILDTGEVGYLDHHVPGGTTGFLTSLLSKRIPLLAVGKTFHPALVERLVRADYRPAGAAPGWHWWVARDLGLAVDRRIKRAGAAAMGRPHRSLRHPALASER